MRDSERIRKMLGVSRSEFSRRYRIPIRTLEEWDAGRRNPPEYVILLLERVVKDDMRIKQELSDSLAEIAKN